MQQLKQAVKLAAKIHEDSFKPDGDHKGTYLISLYDAADKACEQVGFDLQATTPVYLLLQCAWNDALSWAGETDE